MRLKFASIGRISRVGAQDGMALITVMMVMMLVSVLMVGFVAAIVADSRANGLDRDQTQAYAAAHAGLEKLTSDLSGLFTSNFSPTAAQVTALTTAAPTVPGFSYLAPDGTSGYAITFTPDVNGNPAPQDPLGTTIAAGPYQGFKGIITPYDITVTARSTGAAEVRMRRTLQTIAVPVFQFGLFSENDLSFFAGPNFNFGGRVHTNANLYLAEGNGSTLTLADRVTAVGEVIRTNLSNGWDTNTNYTGTVNVMVSTNVYRGLLRGEGSLLGTIGSAQNEPDWTNASVGTYNGNIRNSRTGARRLDLPLVSQGAVPVDLIRRPAQNSNESVGAPLVYAQRFFGQASLRILLSDTTAAITSLPTVTATAPVPLDGTATAAQYGPVDATHPPMALSPGPATTTSNGVTNVAVTVTINTAANGTTPFVPVLQLNGSVVNCSGKTATAFTGCVGTPLSIVGAAVTSGPAATTVSVATVPGAATINVASTTAFVPLPFFWGSTVITCTGYSSAQFTTCTGLTGTTGNMPSGSVLSTSALSAAGQPLLNGFIKIEKQNAGGLWTDVTTEILNLGIASRNQAGVVCVDPNPDAIVRLQRLRDNGGICDYSAAGAASQKATDYWPHALYDTREGLQRDNIGTGSAAIALGGVMNYVELDVNNLRRWFAGAIGTTGAQAKNNNGYILYFSDRRNNSNAGVETGEYGFEDVINPADVNGVPNGVLDAGEDIGGLDPVTLKPTLRGNGLLDTYGQTPQNLPAGAALPYTAAALPQSTSVGGVAITSAHARVNRQILFRRALKLVNGGIVGGVSSLPPGFTVGSENPVYVLGDYNALATDTLANPHVPAAIIADAVTLLSNNWNDPRSFASPNSPGGRPAATTGYRVAIIGGKPLSFPRPTAWGSGQDFGTDGGSHNFLRYLENWGGTTLNYRGSIISFYYSRQAVGTYKCCQNVYGPPARGYNFDSEFLTPSLLPPGTPMFRDINTLTFRQLLRPTQ
jgi:type II secretory pathway pseudopilin PulG